jgi:LPS-assembly lipoprotein
MPIARLKSRLPLLAAACLAIVLAGCGFQMRGTATLPFQTLYVDIPTGNAMGAELKRNLRAGTNAKLVDNKEDAEALLTHTGETRTKVILSIDDAGRVREFRLRYAFTYSLVNRKGEEIAPPQTLTISRDYTFNNQVLAKEAEEQLLYRDMQSDLVQQVLRRLAVVKITPPAAAPKPDQ